MSLIKVGSINTFAVSVSEVSRLKTPYFKAIKSFSQLEQVSPSVQAETFNYILSEQSRGLAIKRLLLTKGFEGFLQKIFNPVNEIYFIAWAWDLSGGPIHMYPGTAVELKDVIIPMKVNNEREFIGEGINLFPKAKVKGGIAVRIQIWESDQGKRDFGETILKITNTLENSKLNNLLSLLAMTGVSGATITSVKEASFELGKVIGEILKANGDDYVDFFEGYFASDQPWITGEETYKGLFSELTLTKY